MTNADFYLEDLRSKFLKIDPSKYYLAYSGGKDSGMLFWFLRTWLKDHYHEMYEQYKQIPAVAVNTYMEFPEISRRMLDNADVILTPKLKPHEVIAKVGTPCFSKVKDNFIQRWQNGDRSEKLLTMLDGEKHRELNGVAIKSRFSLRNDAVDLLKADLLPRISSKCCEYLKKRPIAEYAKSVNRIGIIGITKDEGISRSSVYTSCFTKNKTFVPLWDCSEATMNEIYAQYSIPLPSIYKYVNQTGCAGCPYGIGLGHTQIELQLMTRKKRAYVERLFGPAYTVRGLNYKQTDIFQDFDKMNESVSP